MSKTDKKICDSFMYFHEKFLMGHHQNTSPSIPTIALKAKCSARSVNTFIKNYEGQIHFHKNRYNKTKKKCASNLYCLNDKFFEFMILLKLGGFLYKWKKERKDLLIGLSEYDDFLCSYLYKKGHLSTTKLRAGFLSKLRGIDSFLNKIHLDNVPKNSAVSAEIKEIKERRAFQELNDLPLTFAEKEKLSLYWSVNALRESRLDFIYCSQHKKVRHPFAFMTSRAKDHTRKLL